MGVRGIRGRKKPKNKPVLTHRDVCFDLAMAKGTQYIEVPLGSVWLNYGAVGQADVITIKPSYRRFNLDIYEVKVQRSDFLEDIKSEKAITKSLDPLREFMFKQTREKSLSLFVDAANINRPHNKEDIPTYVLIPAFIISEMKIAFQIGFMLYIPFLMIDMVVASILMSMGMLMLPPVIISLPFKILLFVLVDGWYLVVESLIKTF